ncbi:MAG: multicopper oxidase domain-containing protein [Nitrospirota bacterium]|nr:multicopper oxidase domain-containing protein [Nitrospirota bacterium]
MDLEINTTKSSTFGRLFGRGILAALLTLGVTAGVAAGLPGNAQAKTFNLLATTGTVTMPDGARIAIWGYVNCGTNTSCDSANGFASFQGKATLPGPVLDNVPVGDTLTVRLWNGLAESTSFLVPGMRVQPVAGSIEAKMSVTPDVSPGGSKVYNLGVAARAGTYLYESGTKPANQVQMGMYGALIVRGAAPVAAREAVLLLSEIDPAWHAALAATPPQPYSPVYFRPRYFLINGKAYPETDEIRAQMGETVLLRLLNAGSNDHTMVTQGLLPAVVAEDSFASTYPRDTHSIMVAPGQTEDLLLTAGTAGTFPVYDRNMDITNWNSATASDSFPGGMITMLKVFDPATFSPTAGGAVLSTPPTLVSAGQTYTYNVDFLDYGDVSGSAVRYDLAAGASVVTTDPVTGLTIDPVTGRIVWATDPASGGTFNNVTVYIRYSGGEQLHTFSVAVNSNPVFPVVTDQPVNAGATATLSLSATDPDGDIVKLALLHPLADMALTAVSPGNPGTATFNWLAKASAQGDYTVPVQVLATDSRGGQSLLVFNLNVASGTSTAGGPVPVSGSNLVTLSVIEAASGTPINDYKYLITIDNTLQVDATSGVCSQSLVDVATGAVVNTSGLFSDLTSPCPSHIPYQSNATPVGNGTVLEGQGAQVMLPDGRYFVSVLTMGPDIYGNLPDPNTQAARDGGFHKLDGTTFTVAGGATTATVIVQRDPLPLARLLVQVFEDTWPLNGQWDRAQEVGAPTRNTAAGPVWDRFKIMVNDENGGQVTQDMWGNPLCTQYRRRGTGPWATPSGDPIKGTGGACYTDKNGFISIENIAPGKFQILALPPVGSDWVQTTTIEGTKAIDTWVFEGISGPGAQAVGTTYMGFALPCSIGNCETVPSNPGTGRFWGQIHAVEPATPPFLNPDGIGKVVPKPWIALNSADNNNSTVALVRGDANGNFTINNVPDGLYTMVVFDDALDYITALYTVQMPVTTGGIVNRDVEVYDPRFVVGGQHALLIPDWWGNLHGTVFLDSNENGKQDAGEPGLFGEAVNVVHRDGSALYATVTNEKGEYNFRNFFPWGHFMIPTIGYRRTGATGVDVAVSVGQTTQIQGAPDYTWNATGPVLTISNLVYSGTSNRIDWGKKPYPLLGNGYPNGGKTVLNGGISGVIWNDTTRSSYIVGNEAPDAWDTGVPNVTVRLYEALIDPITGQTLHDPVTGAARLGRLLGEVASDSFNAAPPADCPLGGGMVSAACGETMRIWGQVRPAVFDGGYQFFEDCADPNVPNGLLTDPTLCRPLAEGKYLVVMSTPSGYKVLTDNDTNAFSAGDTWTVNPYAAPTTALEVPDCAGPLYEVTTPEHPQFGKQVNDCSIKEVAVTHGNNAGSDFHLFTEVPVPARLKGFVNDNINLEATVGVPQYGDKAGAPFVPISIQDFTGREIAHTYTDENGFFEVMLPSTQRVSSPTPSGVNPNTVLVYANHPGSKSNPDPHYNINYDTLLMVFDMWPGKFTFADMALTPVNGFLANQTISCDPEAGTPRISGLSNVSSPVVAAATNTTPGGTVTIEGTSFGTSAGANGKVTVGGVAVTVRSWADTAITVEMPKGLAAGRHQLLVAGNNGKVSPVGVTLHVTGNGYNPSVYTVTTTIQAAINAAAQGSNPLVLLPPGVYRENVILYRGVALQGWGAGKTLMDGAFLDPVTDTLWSNMLNTITSRGWASVNAEQPLLQLRPTVLVLGRSSGAVKPVLVDGLSIQGAREGGGVFINTFAHATQISNNVVLNNFSTLTSGGVSLGFTQGFNTNDIKGALIRNNRVQHNGTLGVGGGIGINNGTSGYTVDNNTVCANGSQVTGGGIAHSATNTDPAWITGNTVLFNWSFKDGGGIAVVSPTAATPTAPSPGTGTVHVEGNRLQGNYSTEDGSAITINQAGKGTVIVANNMMVNNIAAAQGTIRVQDSTNVTLQFNTVAKNVSTSTSGSLLMDAGYHTAGLVVYPNTAPFQSSLPAGSLPHSNPAVLANVFWDNQSYAWDNTTQALVKATGSYDVTMYLLAGQQLTNAVGNLFGNQLAGVTLPLNLTGNKVGQDPLFAGSYDNTLTGVVVRAAGEVAINPIAVPVTVYFAPLALTGDYHITDGSAALQYGVPGFANDFDGNTRPQNGCYDSGADERAVAGLSTICGN